MKNIFDFKYPLLMIITTIMASSQLMGSEFNILNSDEITTHKYIISPPFPLSNHFQLSSTEDELDSSENTSKSIFQNVTSETGLPADFSFTQSMVLDLNGDNYLDLILTKYQEGPNRVRVFLNKQGTGFKEIKYSGPEMTSSSLFKVAKGLINEGSHTFVLRKMNGPIQIYDSKIIEDELQLQKIKETKLSKMNNTWSDIQFFDHNSDGKLDILASTYCLPGSRFVGSPTYLYEQTQNQEFKDVTEQIGLLPPKGLNFDHKNAAVPSHMTNVCDINNDGKLDIIIAGYGRRWNKLFISDNQGNYSDQAQRLKSAGDNLGIGDYRGNGNSFVSQCGDFNRDGKLDIFQGEITHAWAGNTSDLSSILYNNYPLPFTRFTDFPRPKIFDNQGDIGADIGDLNLDGFEDLVIANSDYPPETKLLTMLSNKAGQFINISENFEQVINPKGVVLFDYDRDGDLDMIMGGSSMRGHNAPFLKMFKNLTREKNKNDFIHFIVQGNGIEVSESPVGVRVSIIEPFQMRELVYGSGQDAVRPLEANFGLGKLTSTQLKVKFQWPNKKTEIFDFDKNKIYRIKYGPEQSVVNIVK